MLRAILTGGVWNGFLLSKVKKEDINCRFCNAPDNDGHLIWDCTFHLFFELRSNPEFLPLMNRDRTHWPRCLLWRGWLPGLTSRSSASPWAVASSDLASHSLEKALGPYPLSTHSAWHPFWDQDGAQDMVDDVPVAPNIWTDGSREPIPHLDVEVAGAGAFVHFQLSSLIVIIGAMLKILMASRRAAPTLSRGSLVQYSRLRGPSIGVLFLLCKLIREFILVSTIKSVLQGVAALLSHGVTGTRSLW